MDALFSSVLSSAACWAASESVTTTLVSTPSLPPSSLLGTLLRPFADVQISCRATLLYRCPPGSASWRRAGLASGVVPCVDSSRQAQACPDARPLNQPRRVGPSSCHERHFVPCPASSKARRLLPRCPASRGISCPHGNNFNPKSLPTNDAECHARLPACSRADGPRGGRAGESGPRGCGHGSSIIFVFSIFVISIGQPHTRQPAVARGSSRIKRRAVACTAQEPLPSDGSSVPHRHAFHRHRN